jgi:hypothetical protein
VLLTSLGCVAEVVLMSVGCVDNVLVMRAGAKAYLSLGSDHREGGHFCGPRGGALGRLRT